MSLLALQRDMRAWLACEDTSAADRLGTAAASGLRVYQNNYRAQLVACLEEGFAQTHAWIGGDAFHEMRLARAEFAIERQHVARAERRGDLAAMRECLRRTMRNDRSHASLVFGSRGQRHA